MREIAAAARHQYSIKNKKRERGFVLIPLYLVTKSDKR
jgi:hypothetical protein